MQCRHAREYLPSYADGTGARHLIVEEHLRGCAACKSELEGYRQMVGDLGRMSEQMIEPPSWLLGAVTETVSEKAGRIAAMRERTRQLSDPKVITGGAVVVAGVLGALLIRGRRRRTRTRRLLESLAG